MTDAPAATPPGLSLLSLPPDVAEPLVLWRQQRVRQIDIVYM
jgi:hypothetical protein